jgi:hypothetical protein
VVDHVARCRLWAVTTRTPCRLSDRSASTLAIPSRTLSYPRSDAPAEPQRHGREQDRDHQTTVIRASRTFDGEEEDGDDDHGQSLNGELGQTVLEELLQVLDVARHPGHDHPGLLGGEEVEGEPLQVGEDLDPEVVHDPGGQPSRHLDLGLRGQSTDGRQIRGRAIASVTTTTLKWKVGAGACRG